MKHFFAIAIAVLALSSCSTLTKTANVANGVNGDVLINPITANIDIANAEQVTGHAQSVYLCAIRLSGSRKFVDVAGKPEMISIFDSAETKVKNSAMYDALSKKDCDVLLHPLYTLEVKKYLFGLIKIFDVDVKGYAAKILELQQVQPGQPDYDVLMGAPAALRVTNKLGL